MRNNCCAALVVGGLGPPRAAHWLGSTGLLTTLPPRIREGRLAAAHPWGCSDGCTQTVAASIDLMNLRVPAIATPLTKRRIGYDEIEGFVVSTIFLGVNHGLGRGRPLWFETLVFRQGTASRVVAE